MLSTEGAPKGNLSRLSAHWVRRDTILWNITGLPRHTYALYYSTNAELVLSETGISGGLEIPLTYAPGGVDAATAARFPHLGAYTTLKLAEADLANVSEALRGQAVVMARDENGMIVDVSGLQIPGVVQCQSATGALYWG